MQIQNYSNIFLVSCVFYQFLNGNNFFIFISLVYLRLASCNLLVLVEQHQKLQMSFRLAESQKWGLVEFQVPFLDYVALTKRTLAELQQQELPEVLKADPAEL